MRAMLLTSGEPAQYPFPLDVLGSSGERLDSPTVRGQIEETLVRWSRRASSGYRRDPLMGMQTFRTCPA